MIAEYGNPESLSCSEACYVTVDSLGSTRLLTDQGGATQQCYDYLPFGENYNRSTPSCYSIPTPIRQQFTSKERDQESGLDNFLARYYSGCPVRYVQRFHSAHAGSGRVDQFANMWSNDLSADSTIAGDNFTILPDGRKNALDLVFTTFPELKDKFDGPDDDFMTDVYYVYGLLATEIVSRWNDEAFRQRCCRFLNSLAESGDSLLEDLLVVCVLERVAVDAAISEQARLCLGDKAGGFLRRVEHEMFGR